MSLTKAVLGLALCLAFGVQASGQGFQMLMQSVLPSLLHHITADSFGPLLLVYVGVVLAVLGCKLQASETYGSCGVRAGATASRKHCEKAEPKQPQTQRPQRPEAINPNRLSPRSPKTQL